MLLFVLADPRYANQQRAKFIGITQTEASAKDANSASVVILSDDNDNDSNDDDLEYVPKMIPMIDLCDSPVAVPQKPAARKPPARKSLAMTRSRALNAMQSDSTETTGGTDAGNVSIVDLCDDSFDDDNRCRCGDGAASLGVANALLDTLMDKLGECTVTKVKK